MDYYSVFIEMLMARGLTDNTIRSYKTYIKPYLAYLSSLNILPEDASWQAMRDYLNFLRLKRGLSNRTLNMVISYLQFFHVYVLHKPWDKTQVPFRKFDSYLPFVPSRQEVRTFLASLDGHKLRLAASPLYSTGMRLDELCHLKCSDIISASKKIHIRQSKNHRDRYVPLPASIWERILEYWYSFPSGERPKEWLFTQQRSLAHPMDKQWVQAKFQEQRDLLGMDSRFSAHSLRHAFATYSYENGMNLLTLKSFLGHKSINSTAIYVHLAASGKTTTVNPFDQIGGGSLA